MIDPDLPTTCAEVAASTASDSQAMLWGIPVAAYIAVLGVLLVGMLQAGVNRQLHKERLKREAITDRRKAFGDLLAAWTQMPVAEEKVREASRRVKAVRDGMPLITDPSLQPEVRALLLKVQEEESEAVQERDVAAGTLVALRTIAQASITDVNSPLALAAGLTILPDGALTPEAWQAFIDAMRADQEMTKRARKASEKTARDSLKPFASAIIEAGTNPGQSPSGAGHHGTDNESASETEGDEHASIDRDEPGSPPGDRQ